jgi:DNA-binding winged helix-turn-helix (wHTH) protein
MATTTSAPAGGLRTQALGCDAQLAAAFHRTRSNNKPGIWQRKLELVDGASDLAEREISFGPFRVLPARRLLLEDDKPVHISSRALDLLITLAQRPGEVVSKSELIAKVWPHAIVVEGNLKLQIATLRRSLADGQAENRYISTATGRGYCFVASVSQSAALPPRQGGTHRRKLRATLPCRWCD